MSMNDQVKPTATTPTTMLSEQRNGKRLKSDRVNLVSSTFFLCLVFLYTLVLLLKPL